MRTHFENNTERARPSGACPSLYGDLHMNIEERMQAMSGDELERLLRCLNFALSGSGLRSVASV